MTAVGIAIVVGAIAVTTVSGAVVVVATAGAVNETKGEAAVIALSYTAMT